MLDKINSLKGFMPLHEGEALAKWAEKFSKVGPILEIGTFFIEQYSATSSSFL